MPFSQPSFTVGIEEEYLLVDPQTGELAIDPPEAFMADCEARLAELVRPEFLRSQVEVGTRVCKTPTEAGDDLAWLRRSVIDVAAEHGLAVIAASTHPFSEWMEQHHTNKERYNILARDMQGVARRLLICGMHVHVGIEDDDMRLDLMGQVAYFLPHLLALSTSSPFWRGRDTGLRSYRLAVFDEVPRTGLPETFDSFAEYKRHVDVLVKAGILEDASMLWWDVRPSAKFPTLEMRIADICTRLEDARAVAALYVCVVRMLYRLRRSNQRWRRYANMLVNENRWRAQRYGLGEGLIDFGRGEVVSTIDLLEELLELCQPDAEALGCEAELQHCRTITIRGTSADRQLDTYARAIAAGADETEALRRVVMMLVEDTAEGV